MTKEVDEEELLTELKDILAGWDPDTICSYYRDITGKTARYEGDGFYTVKDETA